jgi:hypothetical protein
MTANAIIKRELTVTQKQPAINFLGTDQRLQSALHPLPRHRHRVERSDRSLHSGRPTNSATPTTFAENAAAANSATSAWVAEPAPTPQLATTLTKNLSAAINHNPRARKNNKTP